MRIPFDGTWPPAMRFIDGFSSGKNDEFNARARKSRAIGALRLGENPRPPNLPFGGSAVLPAVEEAVTATGNRATRRALGTEASQSGTAMSVQ